MEQINRHIKKEIIRAESIRNPIEFKKKEKAKQLEYFNYWIKNIRMSMHCCKYRQVINEIELRKHNFEAIPEVHWKYQTIEIDAIFKILRKKYRRHPNEITKEFSYQHHACMFWLNQIFQILEHLVLEFRPDLNKELNYNDISIIKPIQCILEAHIKLILSLMIFSQYNHQIQDICAYLSIIERLRPFLDYTANSKIFMYFQRIQLLKVKLFIENCDYISAMNTITKNVFFSFDYMIILGDEIFNIYYYDTKDENYINYYEELNNQQKLHEKNKLENEKNLRTSQKIKKKESSKIVISSPKKSSSSINTKFKFNDKNLFYNLGFSSPKKNNNSLNKEIGSNNEENIRINNIRKKESNKKIIQIKNLVINNLINNNANNKLDDLSDLENKSDIFITKIKQVKMIDVHRKRIIEDIIFSMAFYFYFRAVIFEHLGEIASALDSYKIVNWFGMKFLTEKHPNFSNYMNRLLKCAWNNYNLITKIKFEKEKRNNLRSILENSEELKKKIKLKKKLFKNTSFNKLRLIGLKNNEKKLNLYLDNLGKQLYKEEETRNVNIFNNFTKTGYILSTVKMIDNLLSNDFKHVLDQMKKVEITKQKEDIKNLINKTLMRNKKSSESPDSPRTNFKMTPKKLDNINNVFKKENKNINLILNRNIINNINNIHYKKKNLISLKKNINININKNNLVKNNNYMNIFGISHKKFSITCRNKKNFSFFNSNENSKRNNKLEKLNIKLNNYSNIKNENNNNKNIYKKFFNFKRYNIAKVDPKMLSGFGSSSRSSHSKDKVEKLPVDREYFSKQFIKKKHFLDRLCNKELNFQKKLLRTKSCDREFNKSPEEFNLQKVINDAELNFSIKFEIAKSSRVKKNLNNLIKQNYSIINNTNNSNKIFTNKIKRPSTSRFDNNNKYNINEIKLKELNLDYNKILLKRNELIKRKRNIILGKLKK